MKSSYRKYRNIILLGLSLIMAAFTGCRKFVEIPPPTDRLVTASVFNNDVTATEAQVAIYVTMRGGSFAMAQTNGMLADELSSYSTDPTLSLYYPNALNASTNVGNQVWGPAYNYIYQANTIIAGLQTYTGVSAAAKQQLTGESKFIRAFWHFYLTSLYGDIPLVTGTDYTLNSVLARTPRAQVYQQVIADLQDAQRLLSSTYVDGSNNPGATDRVRPTKWAATALLARVYLYTGKNNADAESQATAVIGNTALYNLDTDLNQVFLANSSEAIWQLATPSPNGGINTPDGNGFILIAAPGTGTLNCTTISPQLMNSFEAGDLRKTNWIGSYTTTDAPITTYYFPYKYKVYSSNTVTEYTMVLRLAEQYLIRAEARAQQGNLSGAIADINQLRAAHGGLSTPLPVPATQAAALSIILHERQVELFCEWGHRWFDLIRTGNANAVMGGPAGVCQAKGGTWNPDGYQQLYPIPQSERSIDHNLTQNPGY